MTVCVCVCDQVLYKAAWSESIGRDCAAFCAKKWVFSAGVRFDVIILCVFDACGSDPHFLPLPAGTRTTCTASMRTERRGSSCLCPPESALHIPHIYVDYRWSIGTRVDWEYTGLNTIKVTGGLMVWLYHRTFSLLLSVSLEWQKNNQSCSVALAHDSWLTAVLMGYLILWQMMKILQIICIPSVQIFS